MRFLNGKEAADFLKDVIYLDKQASQNGFDLTVKKIYEFKNRGEIDFGGGERLDSEIKEIEPELRDPDDDYGWWELEPKTYLIEYNEALKEDKPAILQPLPRLTRNSVGHPTIFVEEIDKVPLFVGENGIAIKENARVSRLLFIED